MGFKHSLYQFLKGDCSDYTLHSLATYIVREQGYVYLARVYKSNVCSKSNDPERRIGYDLAALPCDLLHTFETNFMTALEARMHRRFYPQHIQGEWYELDPDTVDELQRHNTIRFLDIEYATDYLLENQIIRRNSEGILEMYEAPPVPQPIPMKAFIEAEKRGGALVKIIEGVVPFTRPRIVWHHAAAAAPTEGG